MDRGPRLPRGREVSGLRPFATDGTSPAAQVFFGFGWRAGAAARASGGRPGLRLTRLGKCPDLSRSPYTFVKAGETPSCHQLLHPLPSVSFHRIHEDPIPTLFTWFARSAGSCGFADRAGGHRSGAGPEWRLEQSCHGRALERRGKLDGRGDCGWQWLNGRFQHSGPDLGSHGRARWSPHPDGFDLW